MMSKDTIICQMCGREVPRLSNGQKYCEECRKKKQIERNIAYKARKESGSVGSVGTTAICPVCGKPFEKTSGNQKYCSNCSEEQRKKQRRIKLQDMSEEERREEYQKTEQKKSQLYDQCTLYIPKGKRTILQNLSKDHGMSLNAFFNQAIETYEQLLRSDDDSTAPNQTENES